MTMDIQKVPPDGGWGWVIVFATALSNFITVPVMQSFGLLFKDRFDKLQMSATDVSIIINVNAAFGMSLGLFNGSLLKTFGYRKMSFIATLFSSIGIILTSWAEGFSYFLITYSLITSLGTALLMASLNLALNTYFRERRGRATGFAMGFTGLGPVLVPLLITWLLDEYGTQGAVLLLGALSLHSMVATTLLQPVKWHMKTVAGPAGEENLTDGVIAQVDKEEKMAEAGDNTLRRRRRTVSEMSQEYYDLDTQSIYGFETPMVTHRKFGSSADIARRKTSLSRSIPALEGETPHQSVLHLASTKKEPWWANSSLETVNLGSSVKIFEEKAYQPLPKLEEPDCLPVKIEEDNKEKHRVHPWCQRIVEIFDLDLLKDSTYVTLMLGMSMAVCAEINFSLFTPLILAGYDFDKNQVATVMSMIGLADIIFRFIAPFVGDFLQYSAKTMYLISLLMLITSRTMLMLFHDYTSALIVAIGLGIAKGFRTVYMTLVIPNHVPLEKLPSASGIQMLVNAIFTLLSIPVMGFIRDTLGDYTMCIAVVNCITMMTVILWTSELVIRWCKIHHKKQSSERS